MREGAVISATHLMECDKRLIRAVIDSARESGAIEVHRYAEVLMEPGVPLDCLMVSCACFLTAYLDGMIDGVAELLPLLPRSIASILSAAIDNICDHKSVEKHVQNTIRARIAKGIEPAAAAAAAWNVMCTAASCVAERMLEDWMDEKRTPDPLVKLGPEVIQ